MAKNKNKNNALRIPNGSPLQIISESVNKNGKIKGENKKDKKMKKAICPHHRINKKGNYKPTIERGSDGRCRCTMCDAIFPASLFSDEDIRNKVNELQTVNEQAKFMAVAVDAGDDTLKYFAGVNAMVSHYPKTYGKLKEVVQRRDKAGKGKKGKKKYGGGGSEDFGSWG